ncbi:MAG: hypothetical protein KKB37_16175, partial [Alphaproteobacteria bacterium]|nr:hypothetical protein [Alphaproteobacteria bacterium]
MIDTQDRTANEIPLCCELCGFWAYQANKSTAERSARDDVPSAISTFPATIDRSPLMEPVDVLDEARTSALRLVVEVCKLVMEKHLDEGDGRQFRRIIHYCKQQGIINDKLLACIGRVKQPTANRWING